MNESIIVTSHPWQRPFWKPTKGKGFILVYLLAIHLLAVAGLILVPLPSLPVVVMTLILIGLGGLGTTVCYHRTLSHRTLRLNKMVEHVLIFCAMFNGSGAPASWVAYHRRHHSRSDTADDISSPKHGGFWWAHLRWLYQSPLRTLNVGPRNSIRVAIGCGVMLKSPSSCSHWSAELPSGGRVSSGWAQSALFIRCICNASLTALHT